jgi:hypothetical protein
LIKTSFSIFVIFITLFPAYAQFPGILGYQIGNPAPSGGLLSNGIIDIEGDLVSDALYLGTGKGLSRFQTVLVQTSFNPPVYSFVDSVWSSYTHSEGLGKGGVSALDIKDGYIWLATAFDTTTSLGSFTAGGGIAWSAEADTGWFWMPQPVDSPNDTAGGMHPTTTNIQNITYDIAVLDTAVWIASFGGGLRKYSFADSLWHNIPPDDYPFDVYGRYNHRAFAVISAESLLFVGTAAGINKSADGGETWINYDHSNDGLSGNFITALAYQKTVTHHIIWAATWATDLYASEYHSVSKSEDWGQTWTVCADMNGQYAHNFAFDDSIVYTATDEGLWKSADYGQNWYAIPQMEGINYNYSVLEPEVYSAGQFAGQLWVGTGDGLASSPDYGNTWFVYRAFVSTSAPGEPDTYSYPKPFSPVRWEAVRLQYHLTAPAFVTVKIYDFAMDYVTTVCDNEFRQYAGDWYETWNGTNAKGEIVANGVYFYKLTKNNQGTAWGKIVILD